MESYWCFCWDTQCTEWPQCWSTHDCQSIPHRLNIHKPQAKTEHSNILQVLQSTSNGVIDHFKANGFTRGILSLESIIIVLHCLVRENICTFWFAFFFFFVSTKCSDGFIWIIGLCSCRGQTWKHIDESSLSWKDSSIPVGYISHTHTYTHTNSDKCKGSEK